MNRFWIDLLFPIIGAIRNINEASESDIFSNAWDVSREEYDRIKEIIKKGDPHELHFF